jgi:hypothetical protein
LRLETTVPLEGDAEIASTNVAEQLVLDDDDQAAMNQGDGTSVEEERAVGNPASNQAAATADFKQELLFWLDAPLTFIDFLWGLVECAKLLPAEGFVPLVPLGRDDQYRERVLEPSGAEERMEGEEWQQQVQQEMLKQQHHAVAAAAPAGPTREVVPATALQKLQVLLAGQGGLYARLLGISVAAAGAQEVAAIPESEEMAELAEGEHGAGTMNSEAELKELGTGGGIE